MAIRSVAQLKAWFKRGKYPTEAQFADWIDSFFHKEEDRIPISSVEQLPEHLNGKYARTDGEELERKHKQLSESFAIHVKENEADFSAVYESIEELEAEDERLDGCIKEETRRATGVEGQLQTAITAEQSRAEAQEAAIRGEFAAADEKEKTRATAEETKLDGKITAETERATGVEGQLQASITAEQSRATEEETTIRADMTNGDNSTLDAAKKYADKKVAGLVNSAPETLDTLNELAEALNNDPNFAATVAEQIGSKADRTELPGAITGQEIESIFNQ